MSTVPLGFLLQPQTLPLDAILLSHKQPAGLAETRKFRQISLRARISKLNQLRTLLKLKRSERQLTLY